MICVLGITSGWDNVRFQILILWLCGFYFNLSLPRVASIFFLVKGILTRFVLHMACQACWDLARYRWQWRDICCCDIGVDVTAVFLPCFRAWGATTGFHSQLTWRLSDTWSARSPSVPKSPGTVAQSTGNRCRLLEAMKHNEMSWIFIIHKFCQDALPRRILRYMSCSSLQESTEPIPFAISRVISPHSFLKVLMRYAGLSPWWPVCDKAG